MALTTAFCRVILLWVVLCTLILVASTASADGEMIEEITVTAHRAPQQSVPLLHSSTRNDLEIRDSGIGPAALATLPGLAISRSGAFGGQTQIRVRGAEANHLQVLIDGIEVNDPATGSEFDFAHLNLAAVERIEFLPGGQSSLWGSDAVTGVLNLITDPTQRTREASVTGGAHHTWQANARLADRAENHHYSLALSNFRTHGTNHALTGDEDDGYRQQHLHLNTGLRGEAWQAKLVMRYLNSRTETDPSPFPAFVPADGDHQTRHAAFSGKVEVSLDGQHPLWQPVISASWLDTDNANRADGTTTNTYDGGRRKLSLMNRAKLADQHHLTMLLEHEEERFVQRGTATAFGDPNQHQRNQSQGIALEYLYTAQTLSAAFSARHDANDDFDNAQSYRAALSYRLTTRWVLRGQWGTGLKNPTFIERFGFFPDTFIGNPALQPERNKSVSLSATYQTDRVTLTSTLFRDRLNDEIDGFVFSPQAGTFTAENIAEISRREGAEVSALLRVGNTILSAGYQYIDADDPSGQAELRRPRHSGHLQFTSSFAESRVTAQLGAVFTGQQRDTDFGTFRTVTLDDYTRVHASLACNFTDTFSVALRIENALDEETTDVFGFNAPGRSLFVTTRVQF